MGSAAVTPILDQTDHSCGNAFESNGKLIGSKRVDSCAGDGADCEIEIAIRTCRERKIDLAAGVSIELRIATIGVVVEERLSAGQCVNDRVRCSYCFLKNALFPY